MYKPDLTAFPPLTHTNPRFGLHLNCQGETRYTKMSYPVKYGVFHRLETPDLILEFDLNHELRHARSKTAAWLHPQEWLKRTMGNDWVYYSTGGYAGVFESIGEYYLPNLTYTTNALLGGKPFNEAEIRRLSLGWHQTLHQTADTLGLTGQDLTGPVGDFFNQILAVTPEDLENRASTLFSITGERTTVLPPDARHSDYDVIPLCIADGCLYKCAFCKVKNKKGFTPRTRADIDRQIQSLKALYGRNLVNFNSLFLGEHDALNAPADTILYAAQQAYQALGFAASVMTLPRLYLFGSVDALLGADPTLFQALNQTPFLTHINIGLESADQATLERIGKPLTAEKVRQAFGQMQEINRTFERIEMTCNFIMDESLPKGHADSMLDLVRESFGTTQPKGTVYLSPLRFGRPSREILFDFYHLKTRSRLPMFLYIIQRL